VKNEIEFLKGVTEVDLEITFEPPWDQEMMSEEAKLELGLL
jgi:metal-sulfur cluster biosynthetic enzyme